MAKSKLAKRSVAPNVTPKFEFISPALAERLLNHNTSNRNLRTVHVEEMVHDMKNGTWRTCVDNITIYEDGAIADGQHRLWAIVESGIGQWFIILRGLDRASGLHINTNIPRTLMDNAHISGTATGLSLSLLAISRGIETGDRITKKATPYTDDERLGLVAKHLEAATFAIHHGGKHKFFCNAALNSAIARAWYVEDDKARLMKYGAVVSSGFGDGEPDSAAIVMRNYIMSNPGIMNREWRDSFFKAQNTIWYFMRRKKLLSVRTLGEERYPLSKKKLLTS